MRSIKIFGGLGLVLSLAACADDSGDVESASKGWRAANTALSGGQQEFAQQVEVGVEGNVSVGCAEGGSMKVEGSMNGAEDFSLSIIFDACQADGILVDGELSFAASVTITETSTEVMFDYAGHLEFSGAVEASCAIDATGRVATATIGNETTSEVRFEGHICGVSADAVVETSS
jgi:hypothetical protein